MATTLTGSLRFALEATTSKDYGITGNTVTTNLALNDSVDLASGDTDRLYQVQGTLADLATVEYDLLTILDPFGTALNLTKLMVLVVKNTTAVVADAASIMVSGGASNGWVEIFADPSDKDTLPPNTSRYYVNPEGWTVDGTHKVLKLQHNGTGAAAATYELVVIGLAA